jgi:hypothetical protein
MKTAHALKITPIHKDPSRQTPLTRTFRPTENAHTAKQKFEDQQSEFIN